MEIRENLKNIISYIFVLFIILMGLTLVNNNAKAQSDESEKMALAEYKLKLL